MRLRCLLVPLLVFAAFLSPAAVASEQTVATTWRLLDYIAVDYREAVADGAIVNQTEFDEMVEFSSTAASSIQILPATPGSQELNARAGELQRSIQGKAPAEQIATQARTLAALLVRHYPIPLSPTVPPQHERGKTLYAQLCATCHGPSGAGDGPASAGLDPPPIDFTDQSRANERSVFALYQVIGQGLEGTSMVSYASLPEEDRWALATYVGAIAYPQSRADAGRELLERDSALRARLDLDSYVGTTPATLAKQLGQENAQAVIAYLRRHPEAVHAPAPNTSLGTARTLLKESMEVYRSGDATRAKDLALAAYLDGFEPVEPLLAARDSALMVKIEAAMARVRTGIAGNVSADDLQVQVDALGGLFNDAQVVLSQQQASSVSSFVAAFTILLREGLEALLIVVALIALLHKAKRTEMLPWVHAGWLAALLAGVVTWALATWVINISGASRELTEGFGSLLAAIVLVWVGIWMHGKSHADAWQRYVREKMNRALSKKSGIFLLGLVFLVVYREVFETILFFAAIWNQGGQASVVAGGATAALVLLVVGWVMMRYSRRLPIGQFFRYSAWLIAVLAVVLTGKAVSALQEAGYLPITWFEGGLRVELLGIYPTLQGVAAQIAVALLLVIGFTLSARSRVKP
jgi:high-affinity iron transporter